MGSLTWTTAFQPKISFGCQTKVRWLLELLPLLHTQVLHPFVPLQPIYNCSLHCPISSLPTYLRSAASGSFLKCTLNHSVPLCSVTSHCCLLYLIFCVHSLTSRYPLLQPHSFTYTLFHSTFFSHSLFYLPRIFQLSFQLSKLFPSRKAQLFLQ